MYVIWSHEHNQWWGPDHCGYTDHLEEAGRYTETAAGLIVVRAFPPGIEVAIDVVLAERHGKDAAYLPDTRDA